MSVNRQFRTLNVSSFYGGEARGRSVQFEIGGKLERLSYAETRVLFLELSAWLLRVNPADEILWLETEMAILQSHLDIARLKIAKIAVPRNLET